MEVLKINSAKLKIMLTFDDMIEYGLCADKIDYNDTSTKRSFWKILDKARELSGFDTEGDKVLIQFYPSKDGGCELFITKLGLVPSLAEKTISKSNRITMLASRKTLYKFDDLDSLVKISKVLCGKDSVRESDLFSEREGCFYLELAERGSSKGAHISELAVISEYAKPIPEVLYPYIREHCEKLTNGDAIKQLSRIKC